MEKLSRKVDLVLSWDLLRVWKGANVVASQWGTMWSEADTIWDQNNIESHMHLCPCCQQFMDDEEFVDTVKGFSTVRKEHTMFTDTNL